ncbi:hypothetical protein BXZ70DRAFT_951658 [Cristinia sonorae]|uniref:BHLH domain-containing protein n=1 Tax=Cristinia sonorae TaxID=1940300 RepID=A0A8K0UJU4_9AGAR|nr:hypothetical protein BXZ70DRAFT_951658 [Cristinia sonorae]
MTTTQVPHDPALGQQAPPAGTAAAGTASQAAPSSSTEVPQTLPLGLGQEQVMALLKHLPGVFNRTGDPKDSTAAEALADLSQSSFQSAITSQLPMQHQFQASILPAQQSGPATHPHGPPNLGQPMQTSSVRTEVGEDNQTQPLEGESQLQTSASHIDGGSSTQEETESPSKPSSGRRSGRNATMSNEEWTRQRKDNHKEVERRRRGNINEGINELGRIVPNGSGEKAKGAILNRAVQYIHHLKENEARNIEKWTLEKLLMDQAMGDLQSQLEEMRRLWEGERQARQSLEAELQRLKGLPVAPSEGALPQADKDGSKRPREGEDGGAVANGVADGDDRGKRPRTE